MAKAPRPPSLVIRTVLIWVAFSIVALAYIHFTFVTSLNSVDALDMPLFRTRLSITIIEILVWAVALVSAMRLKHYAISIHRSADGPPLNYIADGITLLVFYVILMTTLDTTRSAFADSPWRDTVVGITCYVPLIVAMVSVTYVYIGSKKLRQVAKAPIWSDNRRLAFVIGFAVLSFLYIWYFTLTAPGGVNDNGVPHFVMNIRTLVVTYALPHVVMWFFGLRACMNLADYSKTVQGPVYKNLFRNLYQGIALVYLATFFAQVLITSGISLEGFSVLAVVVFSVLIMTIVGFLLIYRGTGKLASIEY